MANAFGEKNMCVYAEMEGTTKGITSPPPMLCLYIDTQNILAHPFRLSSVYCVLSITFVCPINTGLACRKQHTTTVLYAGIK